MNETYKVQARKKTGNFGYRVIDESGIISGPKAYLMAEDLAKFWAKLPRNENHSIVILVSPKLELFKDYIVIKSA